MVATRKTTCGTRSSCRRRTAPPARRFPRAARRPGTARRPPPAPVRPPLPGRSASRAAPPGREGGRAPPAAPSALPRPGLPRVGKRGAPVSPRQARPGPRRSRPRGGRGVCAGSQRGPDGAAPVGAPAAPAAPLASGRTGWAASLPPLGLHPLAFLSRQSLSAKKKKLPTAVSLTPRGRSLPLSPPLSPAAH